MPKAPVHLAGLDGCPAGWIVVHRCLDEPADFSLFVAQHFSDILDRVPEFAKEEGGVIPAF